MREGPALDGERDHADEVARLHRALAAAQERSYWLDRWHVDLNALMRKPGASQFRALIRGARTAQRLVGAARRGAPLSLKSSGAGGGEYDPMPLVGDQAGGEFARSVTPRGPRSVPVTDALYGRLSAADVEAAEAALSPEEQAVLAGASTANRKRTLLAFAVHHEVPAVLERTGLTNAVPPENVHAMGRGALAAGGSTYYADIVADALGTAGLELGPGMRGLDFGCSSGRVVRVLAAAYPDVEWLGCDPIEEAVEWAGAHLSGIEFTHSDERPPLPYEDASLDVAYAISIWSHFAEPAAVAWLAEMERLIRPGGVLVLSAHGLQTIAHDSRTVRSPEQLRDVQAALYEHGYWFKDEFGEARDHGAGDSDWGTAFFTADWIGSRLAPAWKLVEFAAGRLEKNQDLYVLERR